MDKIRYYKKLISMVAIIAGAGLLLEHLFQWGFFELNDFIGHEWYGLILIVVGFIISGKWKMKPKSKRHDTPVKIGNKLVPTDEDLIVVVK